MNPISSCLPLKRFKFKTDNKLKCINDDKSWIYKQRIGKPSSYGEVWQACCEKDCRYVAKYQSFGKSDSISDLYYPTSTPKDIEKEIKLQDEIADKGLSVPIIDSWICEHGGIIIMQALKETVSDLILQYKTITVRKMIINKIISLLDKLHKAGFYHGDAHLNNIMVTYDTDVYLEGYKKYPKNEKQRYTYIDYKFYFIDMGQSGYLEGDIEEINFFKKYDFTKVYTDIDDSIDDDETGKLENMKSILDEITEHIKTISKN